MKHSEKIARKAMKHKGGMKFKLAMPGHEKKKKNFMKKAVKHPGALHKALHVKKGEKIPAKKLEKAEHSKNAHVKKMAVLAETFKKYRKK